MYIQHDEKMTKNVIQLFIHFLEYYWLELNYRTIFKVS